jgi:pentapeptide repeat protein
MRAWRSAGTVVAMLLGCAVLGGGLVLCVILGPGWVVEQGTGLTAVERLKAENDVRSTLLQGLGGLLALAGVALGAAMTLRQVRANREGHTIGLFTKAIDQLADDRVPVRHGGVYALELLSDLDPRYRGHAHALLTSFICRRTPWPSTAPEPESREGRSRVHGGLADDVAAALAALGRGAMITENASSELERVDLRGAELDGLDIPRMCLAHSNLDHAKLTGAKLAGATLREATLRNADLSNADLRSADLTGACLDGAVLRGTDLSDARLQDTGLAGVITDDTTRWPRGFSPPHA